MLSFFSAHPVDGELIARNLRDADQIEVRTMTGKEPYDVLPVLVSSSLKSYTAHRNPRAILPTILYGVTKSPLGSDYGNVWLVATNGMYRCRVSFFKAVPHILKDLGEGFKYLHCLADSRNALHNRWLELIGFIRTSSHQVKGVTFHHYKYWV